MKTPRNPILIVMVLCLTALFSASSPGQAEQNNPAVLQASQAASSASAAIPTDQIILKYKTSLDLGELSAQALAWQEQRLSQAGGVQMSFLREMSGEAFVLKLPERLPVEQVDSISRQLSALPEVDYAEPDLIMQPMLVPNDTQYGDQWHYVTPTAGNYGINAPPAWDITTGASNIVVAVVDTGITEHAEFSGRTVPGYDFITDIDTANDGNGRDNNPSDPGDWISAADLLNPTFQGCPIRNSSWHGTHTAGTIGAASNNNSGVTGVNWNSKILPVRVLGKCFGYTSDIADGMRWAAGLSVSGVPDNPHPAKVINMSLGGEYPICVSTYQNAINDIIFVKRAAVVVSAGNSNKNANGFVPANCNEVITVAATNRNGWKAWYSNKGEIVEISAPGGETNVNLANGVLSTFNTGSQGPSLDTYNYYQGTSMSAPHVSGVASLLYSLDPSLTPSEVLQILQDTVTHFPLGSTCDTLICGKGIVNAGAAVQKLSQNLTQTPTPTKTPTPTVTPTPTSVPPGDKYKLYVPLVIY